LRHKIRRAYEGSIANFLEALDHDALARFKALLNDPEAATALTNAHGLDADFIFRIHEVNLVGPL
jgi:hypothetical protein